MSDDWLSSPELLCERVAATSKELSAIWNEHIDYYRRQLPHIYFDDVSEWQTRPDRQHHGRSSKGSEQPELDLMSRIGH